MSVRVGGQRAAAVDPAPNLCTRLFSSSVA
jgi:hypothetical protein